MGTAWLLRLAFEKARSLMKKQEAYCESLHHDLDDPFPHEWPLEPLIAVITGQAHINCHVYTAYDMEMLIRVSHGNIPRLLCCQRPLFS
jgi:hypothetical protein